MQDIRHRWLFPESPHEAIRIQEEIRKRVFLKNISNRSPVLIGGVDVSNNWKDPLKMVYAAATVISYPSLQLKECATSAQKQEFPYIPGLLGFREVPALVEAFDKLIMKPDVIMVDGHGISHPRGVGVASHLGVLLNVPTIGVAKSILVGSLAESLSEEVGSMVPLVWKGQTIAMVIRSKKRCSPLIISPGHLITLEKAVELVMRCFKGYRLPEPTRLAHLNANACRLLEKTHIETSSAQISTPVELF